MTCEETSVAKHEDDDGITCKEFIGALVEYLARELSSEDEEQMELHLDVCADCVKYLETYDVTIKLGRKALTEDDGASLPEDFVKVVLSSRKKR